MSIIRNNHVFKGHKTLLGHKFVTYGELELPTRYEIYPQSESGFDWGYTGSAAKQLAFAMLYQISDEKVAKENVVEFASDIVKQLNGRDWVLSASEVLRWIQEKGTKIEVPQVAPQQKPKTRPLKQRKSTRVKQNVIKDICNELNITQKQLAKILEVPEGTVSSWAVKNEIPRLGKKAIEFYMQNQKNQKIVDSYQNFLALMKNTHS